MSAEATARVAAAVGPVLGAGRLLRAVTDADGPGLTALIGAAYDEYACGPLDPTGFDADLAAPSSSAARSERSWWVVVDGERVVASVAHGPRHDDAVELHRLYLAPEVRGAGLATALVTAIADEARRLGARTLDAWSDTRLVAAHARYLSLGFMLSGARRELHDPAGTTEAHFSLPL